MYVPLFTHNSNCLTVISVVYPINVSYYLCTQFICDVCKKDFASNRTLEAHQKLHHASKLLHFKCSLCDISLTTKYSWVIHMKEIHDVIKTIEEAANYSYFVNNPKKKQISNAKKKADKEKRERCACDLCGKDFFKFSNLKRHMLSKHNGIFLR